MRSHVVWEKTEKASGPYLGAAGRGLGAGRPRVAVAGPRTAPESIPRPFRPHSGPEGPPPRPGKPLFACDLGAPVPVRTLSSGWIAGTRGGGGSGWQGGPGAPA